MVKPLIDYLKYVADRVHVQCKLDIQGDLHRLENLFSRFYSEYKGKQNSVRALAEDQKLIELLATEESLK